jgi:hypothetical protein
MFKTSNLIQKTSYQIKHASVTGYCRAKVRLAILAIALLVIFGDFWDDGTAALSMATAVLFFSSPSDRIGQHLCGL